MQRGEVISAETRRHGVVVKSARDSGTNVAEMVRKRFAQRRELSIGERCETRSKIVIDEVLVEPMWTG
ncbi:MAG: hypothetical protein KDC46_10775 [Thermoleophilia bacterium]|nr:hypothetical protein [Thermoleophilia bacterium]